MSSRIASRSAASLGDILTCLLIDFLLYSSCSGSLKDCFWLKERLNPWSDHDVGMRRITHRIGTHPFLYRPLYLVELALWHEKPRSGGASLTTIQERQDKCRRDGLVERGVIRHNCW